LFIDFDFAVARLIWCWGHGQSQVIWTRHTKWV